MKIKNNLGQEIVIPKHQESIIKHYIDKGNHDIISNIFMNTSGNKNQIMMQPGGNYTFPGQYVTEYPMMQPGGQKNPPIYVTDPNDARLRSYQDSSALYHSYLRNLDRLKQLGLPVTQTDDKPSTLDYRAHFNKHLLSFPQIRKKAKEKGIILEKHMYEQGVPQPYLVQGKDVFDNLVNKSLKTPKVDTLYTLEAAHRTIKPVGLDKVFPPSVIEDTYDGTRRKKREWVTDASGNIINDTGFQEEGKNVNFKSRIIENTPLFTQRYAEPVQPVELQQRPKVELQSNTSQSMQSLQPWYMQSSPISMQGQLMQIQPMTLPQQKGKPVYGPGNTIIGYSNDNMKFNPAYQYTGAPNNQFNLQDKELLNNPELLKQYIYNQDSGYHYKGGGEMIKRADGSYSRPGLWDNIRNNRGSGKAPTKQMLEQERKIRNQYQGGGENNNLKNINLNLPVIRQPEMKPFVFNKFLVNDRNQNLFIGGINPRYQNEDFSVGPYMIGVGNKYFQKFPADIGMSGTYHVNDNFDINMGAGQNNINAGIRYNFANGGYVVRRSHDRKGKTHVVTGPDGTKKYFGDPNMGERGNSKYGKEAFYARHKHNLEGNPYFRAYARATWEEGGETMINPIVKNDTRNWLEYLND